MYSVHLSTFLGGQIVMVGNWISLTGNVKLSMVVSTGSS